MFFDDLRKQPFRFLLSPKFLPVIPTVLVPIKNSLSFVTPLEGRIGYFSLRPTMNASAGLVDALSAKATSV